MTEQNNTIIPTADTAKATVYAIGRASEPAPVEGKILVSTDAHSGWSKGWCARLTKAQSNPLNNPDRLFLPHYRSSLSRAGNGTITYEITEVGYYQADSVARSYESTTEVFRVEGGEIFDATLDEALAHLSGLTLEELTAARAEEQRQIAERRAEASKVAGEAAAASGLPTLKGSEKQIAWAETIRAKALAQAAKSIASLREEVAEDEADDTTIVSVKEFRAQKLARFETGYARLEREAQSRFWIDLRHCSARELLEVVL